MELEHPLLLTIQNAGLCSDPQSNVCNWRGDPNQWPTLQNFNRNHEMRSCFQGFINCDQPPSAVTHVIPAAVMTPSKGRPWGGRRQGGGYEGNGASEVFHLPLNRSRTPTAGGGQGQLWKITPLCSPVFGDGSWAADGSRYFLCGWIRKRERDRERGEKRAELCAIIILFIYFYVHYDRRSSYYLDC